jgi:hypothetical protein
MVNSSSNGVYRSLLGSKSNKGQERRYRPRPPTVRCSTDSGYIAAPPRTAFLRPAPCLILRGTRGRALARLEIASRRQSGRDLQTVSRRRPEASRRGAEESCLVGDCTGSKWRRAHPAPFRLVSALTIIRHGADVLGHKVEDISGLGISSLLGFNVDYGSKPAQWQSARWVCALGHVRAGSGLPQAALPQTADIGRRGWWVSSRPSADSCTAAKIDALSITSLARQSQLGHQFISETWQVR